ncbi:MAG: KEOPS complex subunit Pcc1 [Halobacteriaceae archaeon]
MTSKKSTSRDGAAGTHETVIEVTYDSVDRAAIVSESVGVETGRIPGARTATTVERRGRTVCVSIEAEDLAALRAGVFTWCGLLEAAEESAGGVSG